MMDSNNVEKIEYFKNFIGNLARGINPLTGEIVEKNDTINDINISRVFFELYEYLNDEINNEKSNKKIDKKRKLTFVYDEELISKIIISEEPISLSEITNNIKEAYNNECKITYYMIAKILKKEGILVDNNDDTIKRKLIPAKNTEELGITIEQKYFNGRVYKTVVYNERAQKMILDLLKKYYSKK